MKKILKIAYTLEEGGILHPLPEFCLPQLKEKIPFDMPLKMALQINEIIPWFGLWFLTKDGWIIKYNIYQLKNMNSHGGLNELIKNEGWVDWQTYHIEPKRFVINWEEWTLSEQEV